MQKIQEAVPFTIWNGKDKSQGWATKVRKEIATKTVQIQENMFEKTGRWQLVLIANGNG
jgi:hypothetical protein